MFEQLFTNPDLSTVLLAITIPFSIVITWLVKISS
jgi:hypothetical protein